MGNLAASLMTLRLLARSHPPPMLLDSYNLARRSYSEGECPLHQGHFAGSLSKNIGWRVFLCVKLPEENPRRLRYLPTLLRQRLLRAQVHFADRQTGLSGD